MSGSDNLDWYIDPATIRKGGCNGRIRKAGSGQRIAAMGNRD